MKTPISIKIGKSKVEIGIFGKIRTCQSGLLIPIQINTTTMIVRDILIGTQFWTDVYCYRVPKTAKGKERTLERLTFEGGQWSGVRQDS